MTGRRSFCRTIRSSWEPVGEVEACGILAVMMAAASVNNWSSGIGIGEFALPPREAVEMRRLVILAPIAAEIRPAEIVGKDEYDVRRSALAWDGP